MSNLHNCPIPQRLDAASILHYSSKSGNAPLSGMKFVTKPVDETKQRRPLPENKTVVRKVSRLGDLHKLKEPPQKKQPNPLATSISSAPAIINLRATRKQDNSKTRKVAKIGPNIEDYVACPNSWRRGQEKALKILGPMKFVSSNENEEVFPSVNGEMASPLKCSQNLTKDTKENMKSEDQRVELTDVDPPGDNDFNDQAYSTTNKKKASKRKAIKPMQEAEKQQPISKTRHYNAEVVRTYIDKQRKERKLQMLTEKEKRQKEAEEKHEKLKHLQELQKKLVTNVQSFDEKNVHEQHHQSSEDDKSSASLALRIIDSANERSAISVSSDHMLAKRQLPPDKVASIGNLALSCNKLMDEILGTFQADSQRKFSEVKKSPAYEKNLKNSEDKPVNRIEQLRTDAADLQLKFSEETVQFSQAFSNHQNLSSGLKMNLPGPENAPVKRRHGQMNGGEASSANGEEQYETYHERIVRNKNKFTIFGGNLPGIDNLIHHAQKVAETQKRVVAATTIQAHFRGWHVRKLLKWRLPSVKTFKHSIHAFKLPIKRNDHDTSDGSLSEGPLENCDSVLSPFQHPIKSVNEWTAESALKPIPVEKSSSFEMKASQVDFNSKPASAASVSSSQFNFINTVQRTLGKGKLWEPLSPKLSLQGDLYEQHPKALPINKYGHSENNLALPSTSSASSNDNVEVRLSSIGQPNGDKKKSVVSSFTSSEATITYSTTFSSGTFSQMKKVQPNADFMTSTPVVDQQTEKNSNLEGQARDGDTSSISEGTLNDDSSTVSSDAVHIMSDNRKTDSAHLHGTDFHQPGFSGATYAKPTYPHNLLVENASTTTTDKVLKFSPNTLKLRMSTELTYLDSIENSLQQLKDVERIQAIALAQQESVSLAQLWQNGHQTKQNGQNQHLVKQQSEGNSQNRKNDDSVVFTVESGQNFQTNTSMTINVNAQQLFESQAEAAKITAEATKQLAQVQYMAMDYANSQLHTANEVATAAATSAAIAAVSSTLKHLLQRRLISPETHSPSISRTPSSRSAASKSRVQLSDIKQGSSRVHSNRSRNSQDSISEDFETFQGNARVYNISSLSRGNSQHSVLNPSLPEEIPSLSEGSISESVLEQAYSSKFEESVSGNTEQDRTIPDKPVQIDVKDNFRVTRLSINSASSHSDDNLSQTSSNHNSLSAFTMQLFLQYIKEEQLRAKHQEDILNLRERSVIEKTKAEMTWLELQKQKCSERGEEEKVSTLKKRQRALLLKLEHEQAEIQRLRDAQKLAVQERELLLRQQQQLSRMRKSTSKLMEKIEGSVPGQAIASLKALTKNYIMRSHESSPQLSGKLDDASSNGTVSSEEEFSLLNESGIKQKALKAFSAEQSSENGSTQTSPTVEPSKSTNGLKNSQRTKSTLTPTQTINNLKKFQVSKRDLTAREQKLQQRRKNVEELLYWRHKLDNEERYIQALEAKAKSLELENSKKTSRSVKNYKRNKEHADKQKAIIAESADQSSKTNSTLVEEFLIDKNLEEISASAGHSNGPSISENIELVNTKSISEAPDLIHEVASEVIHSNSNGIVSTSNKSNQLSEDQKVKSFSDHQASFESSVSTKKTSTNASFIPPIGFSERHSILPALRSPLSPRAHLQKRRDSSGSEESFNVSHSEPTSDVSDFEGRINVLKEQLRRRKVEAERLHSEQKRRNREHMKAQEESLLMQIEAYDKYINEAKANLEKEVENELPAKFSVRPQIRQPKVAESKHLLKLDSSSNGATQLVDHLHPEDSLPSNSQVSNPSVTTPHEDKTRSSISEVISTSRSGMPPELVRINEDSHTNEDKNADEDKSANENGVVVDASEKHRSGSDDDSTTDSVKTVTEQVEAAADDDKNDPITNSRVQSSVQEVSDEMKNSKMSNTITNIAEPDGTLEHQLKIPSEAESNKTGKLHYEDYDSMWEEESVSEEVLANFSEILSNGSTHGDARSEKYDRYFQEALIDADAKISIEESRSNEITIFKPEQEVEEQDEKALESNDPDGTENGHVSANVIESSGIASLEIPAGSGYPRTPKDNAELTNKTEMLANNLSETFLKNVLNESIAVLFELRKKQLGAEPQDDSLYRDGLENSSKETVNDATPVLVCEIKKVALPQPIDRNDSFTNSFIDDALQDALTVVLSIYSRRRTESHHVQQQSVSERVATIMQGSAKNSKQQKEWISTTEVLSLSSPTAYSDVLSYFADERESEMPQSDHAGASSAGPVSLLQNQVNMVVGSNPSNRLESEVSDQQWFDDDLGLGDDPNYYYQIYPYYFREIPNKPPPPYTPPKQAQNQNGVSSQQPGPVGGDVTQDISIQVLLPVDDLRKLIQDDLQNIYNHLQGGKLAEELVFSSGDDRTVEVSGSASSVESHQEANFRAYQHLIFDFTREATLNVFATHHEPPCPVWMKPKRFSAPKPVIGTSTSDDKLMKDSVQRQVMCTFEEKLAFSQAAKTLMVGMRYSRKKLETVDEILIREVREEELDWVNYNQDELTVKNKLADDIFGLLVGECCTLLKGMEAKMTTSDRVSLFCDNTLEMRILGQSSHGRSLVGAGAQV